MPKFSRGRGLFAAALDQFAQAFGALLRDLLLLWIAPRAVEIEQVIVQLAVELADFVDECRAVVALRIAHRERLPRDRPALGAQRPRFLEIRHRVGRMPGFAQIFRESEICGRLRVLARRQLELAFTSSGFMTKRLFAPFFAQSRTASRYRVESRPVIARKVSSAYAT